MAKYWLMKTEPDEFSMDDLQAQKREFWNGVRNYLARNYLRETQPGDLVLIYHSSAKPTGVAGVATVASEVEPDPTAFDPKSDYYDSGSKPESPRWFGVYVQYKATFPRFVDMETLKKDAKLKDMVLFQNSRLSVQPVTKEQFEHICHLGGLK